VPVSPSNPDLQGATAERCLRLLLADASADQTCLTPLLHNFHATHVRTIAEAERCCRTQQLDIVVVDLDLGDGAGLDLVAIARSLPRPLLAIVTTAAPSRIPAALRAGCSAVLLKPYAPNLLCSRIGRLLRGSDVAMRLGHGSPDDRASLGRDHRPALRATTNQVWNDIACVRCSKSGAINFDFADHRRMWLACVACEHVWLTRRRD
jgi:DNA-binding response OmpR family regulator